MKENIVYALKSETLRKDLVSHPFIRKLSLKDLVFDELEMLLSQWYYPLHYFPNFLAKLISISPSLKIKSLISKILWQELGEGDPERSHEYLFQTTMIKVGFKKEKFIKAPILPSTDNLIEHYKKATDVNYLQALGFAFGTEVVDLAMVSGVGRGIRNLTGYRKLEWVDIHIKQEPDHTHSVETAIASDLTEQEEAFIVSSAKDVWQSWMEFFNGIENQINV